MADYIIRAKRFIREFSPYINGCNTRKQVTEAVLKFNREYNRKVIMKFGQTRIVLITSDYVVKMDYGDRLNMWGGIHDEYDMYCQAEQDGFEYLFAKITLFTYGTRTYGIMPKVTGIGKYWDDANEYMTDEENQWCEDHCLFDLHQFNYGWKNGRVILIDYAAHDA